MNKRDLMTHIASLLQLVPLPAVSEAGALLGGIMALTTKGEDTDGVLLTAERQRNILAAAIGDARRMADVGRQQLKAAGIMTDTTGPIVTGSTGE